MPKATVVFLLAALWSIAATAQDDAFFMELPREVLPGGAGGNAFAVVGTDVNGGAFRWMPTTGTQAIGGLSAVAVSRDGTIVVGRALDNRGLENAALWEAGLGWRPLASFTPDTLPCDQLLSSGATFRF